MTQTQTAQPRRTQLGDRTLLIVDDDGPFRQRLAQAMERRGYAVTTADSVAAGIKAAGSLRPAFAVVDLRLGDGSGLEIVPALRAARADARIVVLTGYGNTASAVAAMKSGAVDCLPKPADADAVEAALLRGGGPPCRPLCLSKTRFERSGNTGRRAMDSAMIRPNRAVGRLLGASLPSDRCVRVSLW